MDVQVECEKLVEGDGDNNVYDFQCLGLVISQFSKTKLERLHFE